MVNYEGACNRKLLNHSVDYVFCLCHQFENYWFRLFEASVFNDLASAFIRWPIINTKRLNEIFNYQKIFRYSRCWCQKSFSLSCSFAHHTTALTFNASSDEYVEYESSEIVHRSWCLMPGTHSIMSRVHTRSDLLVKEPFVAKNETTQPAAKSRLESKPDERKTARC